MENKKNKCVRSEIGLNQLGCGLFTWKIFTSVVQEKSIKFDDRESAGDMASREGRGCFHCP